MNGLMFGLEVLALGFIVVLIALILLALILELFHRLFGDKPAKTETPAIPVKTQAPTAVEKPPAGTTEKAQLVAASIGAILYTLETGGYGSFAIREIKALPTQRSNWSMGGRANLLNSRRDFVSMRRRKKG